MLTEKGAKLTTVLNVPISLLYLSAHMLIYVYMLLPSGFEKKKNSARARGVGYKWSQQARIEIRVGLFLHSLTTIGWVFLVFVFIFIILALAPLYSSSSS